MILLDIALVMNNELSHTTIANLIDTFGSAENIFASSPELISQKVEMPLRKAQSIFDKQYLDLAKKELKFVEKAGAKAVCATDDIYPIKLREGCANRPHVLFYRGDIENIGDNAISIVGTREYTEYGKVSCCRIIEQIVELCPDAVVVSGLAFGIDSVAHNTALDSGLRTVAVLANPIDQINPAANRNLAEKIVANGGAIITEQTSQTKYHKGLHIERNRIVAAISKGTLVVESPADGGSMHTAQAAFDYDRAVMAVPGKINSPQSFGTNNLIKTQKAQLVTCGMDVARYIDWEFAMSTRKVKHEEHLTDFQQQIMTLMSSERISEAQIAMRLGVRVSDLHMDLFSLEMLNLIRPSSGGYYFKI